MNLGLIIICYSPSNTFIHKQPDFCYIFRPILHRHFTTHIRYFDYHYKFVHVHRSSTWVLLCMRRWQPHQTGYKKRSSQHIRLVFLKQKPTNAFGCHQFYTKTKIMFSNFEATNYNFLLFPSHFLLRALIISS